MDDKEAFEAARKEVLDVFDTVIKNKDSYGNFLAHFEDYIKGTENANTFDLFKYSFSVTVNQIMAIRFRLGDLVFKFSDCTFELGLLSQKYGLDFSKNMLIDNPSEPIEVRQLKQKIMIYNPEIKVCLKSFYIFNKILFDIIAQIVLLAYFKKGGQIGKVWKMTEKPIDRKFVSGYTEVFGLDDKDRRRSPLFVVDPIFYDKISQLNLEYQKQIRFIREDFIHNFSDINFIVTAYQKKACFFYQLVSFENAPKITNNIYEKGSLYPIKNIDEIFIITSKILDCIADNFSEERKNQLRS